QTGDMGFLGTLCGGLDQMQHPSKSWNTAADFVRDHRFQCLDTGIKVYNILRYPEQDLHGVGYNVASGEVKENPEAYDPVHIFTVGPPAKAHRFF
ncbi:hypothetical protein BGX34_006428, partial [Mortierella sp. NVP85]